MADTTWISRLDTLIERMKKSPTAIEYPFDRLGDLVDAPSKLELARELTRRVAQSEIRVVYRVISPTTGAGILEFDSILQIPSTVYDNTADLKFLIDPTKDVEIIYKAA